MRLTFIFFVLSLHAIPVVSITNIILNGFMYQLADSSVIDITNADFTGDDCATLPCPMFTIPSSCSISPTVPAGLLQYGWSTVFLASAAGLTPVIPWIPAYTTDTSYLVDATGTVALTDAGWVARILLRCTIPCPGGTYLVGSQCLPCWTGTWGTNNVCVPCTNGPVNSVYTGAGSANNCAYVCPANTFAISTNNPYLIFGDGTSLRGVSPTSALSTLYRLPVGDPALGFKFMTAGLDPNLIYVGVHSISVIDLVARRSTSLVGGGPGYADGVGGNARFNSIGNVRPYGNTQLLVVDGLNSMLRLVDLVTNSTTTVAGNINTGYYDGQGTAAKFRYPGDVIINAAQDTAYVSDQGNGLIRQVVLSTWTVTTLVGTGIAGSIDGIGRLAYIDPRYLALDNTNQLLYVQCPGNVRRVDLSTLAVTTIAPSGFGGMIQLGATQLYFPSGSASFVALPSSTVVHLQLPGMTSSWPLIVLVNETTNGQACVACVACAPGRFSVCNSTASTCPQCPVGSASPWGVRCQSCATATYASAAGMSACTACLPGSVSYGYTPCTNCSVGLYASSNVQCSTCANGTYTSTPGATVCSACTGLIPNTTWTGPGVNATSCPFACISGMALSGTVCVTCAIGTWSSQQTAQCLPCTSAPANATYTGVGTSTFNCPYQCNTGFVRLGPSCIPCLAGTRALSTGNCSNCTAGSFSAYAAATICTLCDSGTYSLTGASTCTPCATNRFTVFIGRSASSSCVLYCKAGSYIAANRCIVCVNGTFSATAGATACSACAGGTWSGLGAAACGSCGAFN